MILDKTNLTFFATKAENGNSIENYTYKMHGESGEFDVFINFTMILGGDKNKIIVEKTILTKGEPKKDGGNQEFEFTGDGFILATKFFEDLVRQQEKENAGDDGGGEGDPLPPIGFLYPDNTPVGAFIIKMQDGRSGTIETPRTFEIKKNVLEFVEDWIPSGDKKAVFEKGEKYMVDVFNEKDNVLALYPFGESEQGGGGGQPAKPVDQKDIEDIKDGKKPFDKEKNPPKGGTPSTEKDKEDQPEPKSDDPDDDDDDDDDGGEPKEPVHGGNPDPTSKPKKGKGKSDDEGDDNDGNDDDDDYKESQEVEDKLARLYSMNNYFELMSFFGSKEAIIADIDNIGSDEKQYFAESLGMAENSNNLADKLRRILKD